MQKFLLYHEASINMQYVIWQKLEKKTANAVTHLDT